MRERNKAEALPAIKGQLAGERPAMNEPGSGRFVGMGASGVDFEAIGEVMFEAATGCLVYRGADRG